MPRSVKSTGKKMARWVIAVTAAVLMVVAGSIVYASESTPAGESAVIQERQLLRDDTGLYPRTIRLQHNDDANGRILASVVSFAGSDGISAIYESDDDGQTFDEISAIADPEASDGQGLCCNTLFELPQQVGDMPAGTLLWAATVGADEPERSMELRIWRSDDIGHNWEYLSTCATAPDESGLWEPELGVTADGDLTCHYADESDPDHSQKLMQTRSADGITWTDHSSTVQSDLESDRPGMPIVRQLPDGTFLMAFEICTPEGQYSCVAHLRTSTDGWDWGDPADLGVRAETADGKYFTHTPNLTWMEDGDSPTGSRVFLIGQILQNADGSVAPENGDAVLTNTDNGTGTWDLMSSPVPVEDPFDDPCPNYSPAMLPTADGTGLFGVATDFDAEICKPFYGTISLP